MFIDLIFVHNKIWYLFFFIFSIWSFFNLW